MKQGTHELTGTEAASSGPESTPGPLGIIDISLVFLQEPDYKNKWVSNSFACSWNSFPIGWVAVSKFNIKVLASSYILSYLVIIS